MWTFDGEEWTSDEAPRQDTPRPYARPDGEFYPELQIVEITPPLRREKPVLPPLPLPPLRK